MRSSQRHRTRHGLTLSAALAALLSACGGSGGGNSSPPPPPPPPPQFTVGGAVSGLSGPGLVLRNNGGNDLAVAANGAFTFSSALTSGSAFEITVFAQPANQTCSVAQGSGIVTSNVGNVAVVCITNTYSIGGPVNGLFGGGLRLSLNGAYELGLGAFASGFTFPQTLESGKSYTVTVLTQPTRPSQTCTVSNGAGTVGTAHVLNVEITCVTHTHPIGGVVRGLLGSGLVLSNNGGAPLAISSDGPFEFPTPVESAAEYNVVTSVHPLGPAQECTVSRGRGVVEDAPITNVSVDCYLMGRFLFATSNAVQATITGAVIEQSTGVLSPVPGVPLNTGGGASGPSIIPDGRYLYIANHTAQTISGYRVDSATGQLAPVPSSPFAAGLPVHAPTLHPSGKFLYATDQTNAHVFGFAIDSATGELTAIPGSPFTTAASTIALHVDPTGRFAYVVTRLTPGDALSLATFAIDAVSGSLTAAGSPLSLGTGMPGATTAMSADGSSLFVSLGPPDVLHGFTLDASTGAPTAMSGSPFANAGPPRVFPHPRRPIIYVTATDSIRAYAVSNTLTALPGSPYAAPTAGIPPRGIVFDPGARFLYAAAGSPVNSVTPYTIKDDGSLEQVANGTVVLPFTPFSFVADPGGRFLFAADFASGAIQPIAVSLSDGKLTLVSNSAFAGNAQTNSMGIVK